MSQLLEDLRAVRELIGVPERWTQGYYARNARGRCNPRAPDATRWCFWGAVSKVTDMSTQSVAFCGRGRDVGVAVTAASSAASVFQLAAFNDNATHPEVLALLDKAIAAEERKATP